MSQVKEILSEHGWTVTTLSEHFGVSRAHVSNILAGRERPKVLQIALARLVDMTPEALWGDWLYSRPRSPQKRRTTKTRRRNLWGSDGHVKGRTQQ